MIRCPFCSETFEFAQKSLEAAILTACDKCMNILVLKSEESNILAYPPKGTQDIRQIARDGSIGAELLRLLPEAMQDLPVLPEIVHRVMRLGRDPEKSLREMAEVIKEDQVIALKVLQLANSPVYRGLTEVKDLDAACTRLGMKTISNAVFAVATGQVYKTLNPKYGERIRGLWRHALATSHCASEIGAILAQGGPDTLFAAGLIHDVGKLLILHVVSNEMSAAMKPLEESDELLQEVMEAYHALLGFHLVRHWELPAEFGIVTFCHEEMEAVPDDAWITLVHIVALSSAIADVSGFGVGESDISLLSHPSSKFLNLNDVKLAALRVDLEDKLAPLIEIISSS